MEVYIHGRAEVLVGVHRYRVNRCHISNSREEYPTYVITYPDQEDKVLRGNALCNILTDIMLWSNRKSIKVNVYSCNPTNVDLRNDIPDDDIIERSGKIMKVMGDILTMEETGSMISDLYLK